jgi:hypothetical protein
MVVLRRGAKELWMRVEVLGEEAGSSDGVWSESEEVRARVLGTGMAPLGWNSLAPCAEGLIVTGMFV